MNKNGFSTLIFAVLVSVIFLTIFLFYILKSNQSTNQNIPKPKTTDEQIKNKILEEMGNTNFVISHISPSYARGKISDTSGEKDIFLVESNGNWNIVEITDDFLSCERGERLGFPPSIISDCLLEYPKSENIEEVLEKEKEELILAEKIQIKGNILFSNNPDEYYFEIISDDNNSVEIIYNLENGNPIVDQNISNGDYVVIDVIVDENDDGDLIFNLDPNEPIDIIVEELDPDNPTDNSINNPTDNPTENPADNSTDNTDNSDDNSNGSFDQEINNDSAGNNFSDENNDVSENNLNNDPSGNLDDDFFIYDGDDPESSYYQYLLDIDNSNQNIKILSDF